MQDCIDSCGCGYSTQGAIENLFRQIDRFAMELDIVQKLYSDFLTSEPIPETSKQPFTDEEVTRLWENQNLTIADSVIFLLYTGFRIEVDCCGYKQQCVDDFLLLVSFFYCFS